MEKSTSILTPIFHAKLEIVLMFNISYMGHTLYVLKKLSKICETGSINDKII
jgi:hypothetical protein